jgi:hypothetical protein
VEIVLGVVIVSGPMLLLLVALSPATDWRKSRFWFRVALFFFVYLSVVVLLWAGTSPGD